MWILRFCGRFPAASKCAFADANELPQRPWPNVITGTGHSSSKLEHGMRSKSGPMVLTK
jgi:hypothetical protein